MHQAIELGAQLRHVEWLRNVVRRAEPVASMAVSIVPYCVSTMTAISGLLARIRLMSSNPPICGTFKSVTTMSIGYWSRISSACSVVADA